MSQFNCIVVGKFENNPSLIKFELIIVELVYIEFLVAAFQQNIKKVENTKVKSNMTKFHLSNSRQSVEFYKREVVKENAADENVDENVQDTPSLFKSLYTRDETECMISSDEEFVQQTQY